jgi:Tfp pilus assembly protein PilV
MNTNPATRLSRRSLIGRCALALRRRTAAAPAGEDGFLLIEVIISALLVGLIVVATLTGFDVVERTSADQRRHSQAVLLAGQSQEQLRSDPASTLETLQASPHEYTQTSGGTTYTITQKAELQPASGSNAGCSVTETSRQSGNAFRITSTVTWVAQTKAGRPAVVASSLITPPTGSALEVDADNAHTVTAGVAGVTAVVKYTPAGGSGVVTLQQTTEKEGCVVFGAIPATSALVEIPEVAGFVTLSGSPKYETKEVKIAPNYTTHYPVYYNKGGALKAEFTYKGARAYKHANNEGSGEVEEAVTGDTFVAVNSLMGVAPGYEVGSTQYSAPSNGIYGPLPGTFASSATSPSNLFPFAEAENPWAIYAGDCTANAPETAEVETVEPYVHAGLTTTATVSTTRVGLNLYKGTEAEVVALGSTKWKALETATSRAATIYNNACAGTTPNNESAITIKHAQTTTTGAANGGHLADPFQPFGKKYELCVYASPNAYTIAYENLTVAGPAVSIYMGQKSTQEKNNQRTAEVKKEEETKSKREAKEAELRKPREVEEENTRAAAEAKEASNITKWKEQEKRGEITRSQRTSKETAQRTEKTEREATEATKRKAAEKSEKTQFEPQIEEEAAVKAAREAKEKAEATEATNSKVTVETRAACP